MFSLKGCVDTPDKVECKFYLDFTSKILTLTICSKSVPTNLPYGLMSLTLWNTNRYPYIVDNLVIGYTLVTIKLFSFQENEALSSYNLVKSSLPGFTMPTKSAGTWELMSCQSVTSCKQNMRLCLVIKWLQDYFANIIQVIHSLWACQLCI